ncbi:MAG: methyl-accepting chemotaxis protein, partial [Defluviitaleaceae bacterium]|nr:methyl-accepting chemotaxis protein [Defluviitaleaceae bacterium]
MKTLKAKLTFGILLLCVAGMAIMAVIGFIFARNSILKETLESKQNYVGYEGGLIDKWVSEQMTIVETVSTDVLAAPDYDAIQAMLTAQLGKYDYFLDVYACIVGHPGVFGSQWFDPAYDFTTRDWYQATMAKNGDFYISDPYVDAQTGKLCITLARFVGQYNGADAVVAADLLCDTVTDEITSMNPDKNGYIFLTNDTGGIVAHTIGQYNPAEDKATEETIIQNIADIPVYKQAADTLASGGQALIKDSDGISKYFLKYSMPSSKWSMYLAEPVNVIYSSVNSLMVVLIIVFVGFLIIAVAFSLLFVNKTIVRPIAKLSDAARRIAAGDIDFQITKHSDDEIGHLTNNFQVVVSTLRALISDMSDMTREQKGGDVYFLLDPTKYEGAYYKMAAGVNEMQANLVALLRETLACIEGFSKGDFRVPITEYPGAMKKMTVAVEGLRANLVRALEEISGIASEATKGNFATRADQKGFEGEWAELMGALNRLVKAVADPVTDLSRALGEMSAGNLSAHMDGEYGGSFAKMQAALNTMSENLSSYVGEISDVLSKLAGKKLTVSIRREFAGDFGAIKDSINNIISSLNSMLTEISMATEQVSAGAKDVSESSMLLATSASDQALTVDKLSESIGTVYFQSMDNAKKAETMDKLSERSRDSAGSGKKKMEAMMVAIQKIKESSSDISQIMSVINDIAFQTNLLALNAAVEAARAGAAGKGFSVVAGEVRTLAVRSQEAANQTQELIAEAMSRVTEGISIAGDTSKTLDEIVG